MQVLLRDTNPDVCAAMAAAFEGVEAVSVDCADIFRDLPVDAVVSPANSYGYMDGGIDLHYLRRFGGALQFRLQDAITGIWRGELPVGEALVIDTGDPDCPWMISAPTMKVPGPVPDTENAYLAFRAALRIAKARGFEKILTPGLCTFSGRMEPAKAARQMRKAWDETTPWEAP